MQNFFPGSVMAVTIGAQPCGNVTVTDATNLTELACVAPPGPGFGAVQLRVSIDGSGSGTARFQYDRPTVEVVVGTPCDAALACPLQVRTVLAAHVLRVVPPTLAGSVDSSPPGAALCTGFPPLPLPLPLPLPPAS